MSSSFAVPVAGLRDDRMRNHDSTSQGGRQHMSSAAAHGASQLSPYSPQPQTNSPSPTANHIDSPDDGSNLSHYQSSDVSDYGDPFFGADFSNIEGATASFLDDPFPGLVHTDSFGQSSFSVSPPTNTSFSSAYPPTPDQTASIHTVSPASGRGVFGTSIASHLTNSVSPQELQRPFQPDPPQSIPSELASQLTPSLTGSGRSSEDGLAPAAMAQPCQSPRVMVSMWNDSSETTQPEETPYTPENPRTFTTAQANTVDYSSNPTSLAGNDNCQKASALSHVAAGKAPAAGAERRGLGPEERPSTQVEESVNEMMTKREIEEKNQEVDKWLTNSVSPTPRRGSPEVPPEQKVESEGVSDHPISLGHETENKLLYGQTYYRLSGGVFTDEDLRIIAENRNWADAPILHAISQHVSQPKTAQEAILRFNRMCADNESIVSKAATWGTRRRSLPSVVDMDAVTSGNILKRLTIKTERRPSFMEGLRGLVRKPSFNNAGDRLKRAFSGHDENEFHEAAERRHDSLPHLAPPKRSPSWGIQKKPPTPSINTALVAMGGSMGSVGGGSHARSGSISATPIMSPKSPFTSSLKVATPAGRPRSKSDLPKSAKSESHSHLVNMWKKTGGPPVSSLARPIANQNGDVDDEDDDDDDVDDGDLKVESSKMLEDITPTNAGFQQHILRLNPSLATTNTYLVDRIAHQQVVRYKALLQAKVKHLRLGTSCPHPSLCIALGGSAVALHQKIENQFHNPFSGGPDGSDGDITPIDGGITQDSFPPDIPMPPTTVLPAEFECQLCFQAKKFQKPSDWTKHVHEDVQPFTCTWGGCRDPKIFKRKADWVRHENEGHRHLEWWTCDVDECRHVCYRRDNFLQHLVREHKFPEPKVKTKAAMKRAGGIDPTWQKVESCHKETSNKPQEEPCRFCGKTFPSWKKLTVHLAKHMEHISLPVLRLVEAKELDADTLISPIQDAPPRPPIPLPVKREHSQSVFVSPTYNQFMSSQPSLAYPAGGLMYPVMSSTEPYQAAPFYNGNNQFSSIETSMGPTDVGFHSVSPQTPAYVPQPQYQNIPATTSGYVAQPAQYAALPQGIEAFPALSANALGLQTNHQPQMGGQLIGHLSLNAQMGYDSMLDQSTVSTDTYTPQGSVSPYSHSPHQGQTGFYPPQ